MQANSQQIIDAAIKKGQLILQRADEKAEAIIAEAKLKAASEAERVLAEARQQAEREALQILAAAKNKAEMITLIIRQEARQLEHAASRVLTADTPLPQAAVSLKTETRDQRAQSAGEPRLNATAALYQDIVELVVSPPAPSKKLFAFLLGLRKIHGLKVLHFKERISGGFTVKVRLQAAIPLLNILTSLPEVQTATERLLKVGQKDAAEAKGEPRYQKVIEVKLRSQ